MDGMGDLDNTPMPPMGADDLDGEDHMGGMDDPMANGEDPMGGPDDIGGEDPMGGMGEPNEMGDEPMDNNGDDNELMDIINSLSIEDKAAVTKYAKSMADNSNDGGDMMGSDDGMPMESRKNMRKIIDEIINDVIDNKEGTKRPEKKMPKEYRKMEMPFKSPF